MGRFVIVTALASAIAFAQPKPATSDTGVCSYYSRIHDGHITAGGKKFDSNALTAAHRTYPMGTRLKLTNTANNKTVQVVVNDRGAIRQGSRYQRHTTRGPDARPSQARHRHTSYPRSPLSVPATRLTLCQCCGPQSG